MRKENLLSSITPDDVRRVETTLDVYRLNEVVPIHYLGEPPVVIAFRFNEDLSTDLFEDGLIIEDDTEYLLTDTCSIEAYTESTLEDITAAGHGRHVKLIRDIARDYDCPELVEFGAAQMFDLLDQGLKERPLRYSHRKSVVSGVVRSTVINETVEGGFTYDARWHTRRLSPVPRDWTKNRIPMIGDPYAQKHVAIGVTSVSMGFAAQESSS